MFNRSLWSHLMTRWSPIAVVLGVFLVASCGRKPTSTIVLDKPETTLSHTFQQVSNVVELPDGRLAMADVKARSFVFLNPSNGEVEELGEHADTIWPPDSFPSRHKIPGFVLRISADTLGLVDFGAERTTLWTAQGQPLGVINRVQVGGHNQPLNYDAALNGYKEDVRSVLGGLEPGDEVKYDSLNVLRIPRGDTIADTVARLKLPPWGDGQFGEQKKIVSTIFGGRDLFGVLPDGSIWIARASNNAVDWRDASGKWKKGPSRSYTRISVTEDDKKSFLEKVRSQMSQVGAPAGVELSYPFADYKPPFSAGTTGADGSVWLQRSRALGDSTSVWDVVGRDGNQLKTVQLPLGTALAGFGADGTVYLVRRLDGGVGQVVEKYRVQP
ncbi:MAG TPA: hypothetical protein VLK88_11170 [Gemmatimonadales bacterium]|nr:hypothetical protein [Gemmatimonadales bacterium]